MAALAQFNELATGLGVETMGEVEVVEYPVKIVHGAESTLRHLDR